MTAIGVRPVGVGVEITAQLRSQCRFDLGLDITAKLDEIVRRLPGLRLPDHRERRLADALRCAE
jgi:hypothetical protein